MRNTMTWALAAGVALAAAGTASAQGRGFGMPGGGGGVFLLTNPSVQTELKLTDDQKTKLQGIADQLRPKMQEQMQDAFQNAGGDFSKIQDVMQGVMAKITAEGMKEVTPVLKPVQLKRFKEISLQQAGMTAFTSDADVQKALKITDDQKAKVKKLAEDMQGEMMEMFQGGFGQDTQQKITALRKQYNDKADQVLTADQRKQYKDMLGQAFTLVPQPGRRGGGGGGR